MTARSTSRRCKRGFGNRHWRCTTHPRSTLCPAHRTRHRSRCLSPFGFDAVAARHAFAGAARAAGAIAGERARLAVCAQIKERIARGAAAIDVGLGAVFTPSTQETHLLFWQSLFLQSALAAHALPSAHVLPCPSQRVPRNRDRSRCRSTHHRRTSPLGTNPICIRRSHNRLRPCNRRWCRTYRWARRIRRNRCLSRCRS